jgi:nucleotide-binding universal stress UspA family protein
MIEIRQILCPIDFSDFSRRALNHATAIAPWYGATVTLLNVQSSPAMAMAAPEMLPVMVLTAETRAVLLAAMTRFAQDEAVSTVPYRCEIREGAPANEILASAHEIPSDLIVMGTHGRSGFERLVLGSVAEKVLRKAACPVLTVPFTATEVVPAPPLFKRILCAVDFSTCSMHALEYAMSLAQEANAFLAVAHVVDLSPRSVGEELQKLEDEGRDGLSRAVPDEVRIYCTVETLMARGVPYREILRLANEQRSELIVLGIHGRSAAEMFFMGSTTNQVVRHATCPVLTIRSN